MGSVQGFNNCIFREETCQERGACEGEASESQAGGGEGCEVLYAPYFTDVLFVIEAVNNRA